MPTRPIRSLVLAACLVAGLAPGASPATAAETYTAPLRTAVRALPVAAESGAGYDRTRAFGDWVDADDDCRNTRHEVLASESQVTPVLSASGCTVTAGRWVSPFEDRTSTVASQLEIDHLVPLAEAWRSGARTWTPAQRLAFANDLGDERSLNAVSSALNTAKGASGPEQWLPPTGTCRYVEAWTAVKLRWALSVDPAEQAALLRLADGCPDTTLTVALAPAPPPVPPAADTPTLIAVSAQTVDHGGSVALGVLGRAGAVVDLYALTARAPATVIRTTTLTTSGTGGFAWELTPPADSRVARWDLRPGETTRFFAQVRGGDRTATLTVNVRRTVTIGIRQDAGSYVFSGVVGRPVAGLQVTLARLLTSGRVVGVASTTTNAAGAYTIRTRLAPGLGGYYALTGPSPDLQPGRSRLYGLVVPTPRAAAPGPARPGASAGCGDPVPPGGRGLRRLRDAGCGPGVPRPLVPALRRRRPARCGR